MNAQIKIFVQSLTIHSLTIFSGLPGRSSELLPNYARPAFAIVSARQSRPASLACRVEARSESPKYLSIRLRATRYGATAFVLRSAPSEDWRRGRDSNPRRALTRSGFQDRRDRPLCHLSVRRLACRAIAQSIFYSFRLHASRFGAALRFHFVPAKAGTAGGT